MKIRLALLIALLITLFISPVSAAQSLDHKRTLQHLKELPIEDMIPMSRYLTGQKFEISFKGDVHLVTLKGGLKAVFKSFPQGDDADALAEVAAYHASQVLGFPNIPPTVQRTIKGRPGSLQLYVKPSVDTLAPGQYRKALASASPEDIANIKLFYFVFGQWDSGPQNLIVQYDDDGKAILYPIDNASIRMRQHVRYGELPFVAIAYSDKLRTNDSGKPFPFDNVFAIHKPTPENVQRQLGYAFNKEFLEGFSRNSYSEYYTLYQNMLWRQFNRGKPNFMVNYTNLYPEASIRALKNLDRHLLDRIFAHARDSYFLNEGFFNDILDRRDQVLKAYNAQKGAKRS